MKKIIIAVALALCSMSCTKLVGQGELITKSFNVLSSENVVNYISLADAFTITFDDSIDDGVVELTTYSNVMSYIKMGYNSSNYKVSLWLDADRTEGDLNLVARMKMPTNTLGFIGSGKSTFAFDSAAAADGVTSWHITLSGGSKLYGNDIITGTRFNVSMNGGSYAEFTTTSSSSTLLGSIAGSSINYTGYEFPSENNSATISGGGSLNFLTE